MHAEDKTKMESLEKKINEIHHAIKQLEYVIVGDEKFDNLGLIKRQKNDESRLTDLEGRVASIEKIMNEKAIKMDATLITLQKVFFVLGIMLTGFLIIKGALDWQKLVDILK